MEVGICKGRGEGPEDTLRILTEVSIRSQKNPGGWYTAYTCIYPPIHHCTQPSVLWRCWLGGRKGIRPVKNWVVECCMIFCLERDADLHMAQLMPLPLTVSCFSKIQTGFTFLVPAHPGSSGKKAVKRACVSDLVYWVLTFFCKFILGGIRR